MPQDKRAISGVNDSKQLDADTRARLCTQIRHAALAIGVGAASVHEVEELNVFHATVRAMQRAVAQCERRLGRSADHLLIDGNALRWLGREHTAVVRGDATCYSIACASIVAKVLRDNLMQRLAQRYGNYGWERNVGYGTPVHRDAITRFGLTPHHRRTFCQSVQISLELS
jgi:ribonuclease HII